MTLLVLLLLFIPLVLRSQIESHINSYTITDNNITRFAIMTYCFLVFYMFQGFFISLIYCILNPKV